MQIYTRDEFIQYVKEHPDDFIHYCEIILNRSGQIILARPSHTESVIEYTQFLTDKTREELKEELSEDYLLPLNYYVDKHGLVAVWYRMIMISETQRLSRFQEHTINELMEEGILSSVLNITTTNEYTSFLKRKEKRREFLSRHEL